MPSEIHNREPPLTFGNPKSRPRYGMDIFWNRPLDNIGTACLTKNSSMLKLILIAVECGLN